jgi:hypothetical protein
MDHIPLTLLFPNKSQCLAFNLEAWKLPFGLHRKSGTTDFDAEKKFSVKGRLEGKKKATQQFVIGKVLIWGILFSD